MAVTADSVIVELQATTEGYEAKMLRAAQTGTRAMSQIETSATQAETAVRTSAVGMARAADQMAHGFNNTRVSQQILMHVARASADQFAAGAPPMQIFTMHLAQLAEAGAYAGGALGRFGAFLSGPWGIAATVGVMALVPLISRLMDTRSELDKAGEKLREHAHNADIARLAQEAFGRTLPGIAAAIRDKR